MMRAPDIELGMKVWAYDGFLIGRVGRVWHPDGSIVPPLPGTPDVVAGVWGMNDSAGLLQISRFVAPDWFVPFTDVVSVVDHDVRLAFTEKQGRKRGWQERPALSAMVYAGDARTADPAGRAVTGPPDAEPITADRPSGNEARIDPMLAAMLLDQEKDLWYASTMRSKLPAGQLS